jgi:hypothetical protein
VTSAESEKQLQEIEETQEQLRASIEESKRLAAKTQRLLKKARETGERA